MKDIVKRIPLIGSLTKRARHLLVKPSLSFSNSTDYWKRRYELGGNSGEGSYGILADFKAEFLNRFVDENEITGVVEFGCGDGNQLSLANYPFYVGYDISETAVKQCHNRFLSDPCKSFRLLSEYDNKQMSLAISLDVLFHLVEDTVFEQYMRRLFAAASEYVVIYSSNIEPESLPEAMQSNDSPHVRHREFTTWVDKEISDWKLREQVPNPYPYTGDDRVSSFADFFVYESMKQA